MIQYARLPVDVGCAMKRCHLIPGIQILKLQGSTEVLLLSADTMILWLYMAKRCDITGSKAKSRS